MYYYTYFISTIRDISMGNHSQDSFFQACVNRSNLPRSPFQSTKVKQREPVGNDPGEDPLF